MLQEQGHVMEKQSVSPDYWKYHLISINHFNSFGKFIHIILYTHSNFNFQNSSQAEMFMMLDEN